jgi:demethylmenaquinone methyltransferase/2-methoxy-6-polyprenyl-1,4-benzoquinol methylase
MPVREMDAEVADAAAAGGGEKREYVQQMFGQIAPHYDLLNHLLSLGVDRRWRRAAIQALRVGRHPDGDYLDLCAGTLDVSAALVRTPGFTGTVLGVDFAEAMLRAGQGKVAGGPARPVVADALALPLADGSTAGVIVAFGVRNLADLDAGVREAFRVLEPGGRLVIVELSTPRSALLRLGYHAYFHHLLPALGRLVSGHGTAYRYLPQSVAHFPSGDALAARLRAAGFTNVAWHALTLGVAALHGGERA